MLVINNDNYSEKNTYTIPNSFTLKFKHLLLLLRQINS